MTSNYENNCGWALERIEAYLDDELGSAEQSRFERHVRACATCASELRFATRVVGELRSLPPLRTPERVLAAVAARAVQEDAPSALRRLREWLDEGWAAARRPAMAAMLVVIAAVGAFVITEHRRATTVAVTDEEIEAAARQTALAFAYVGKYSRRTGVIIRDEVIGAYVVEPVERAFAETKIIETINERERSGK